MRPLITISDVRKIRQLGKQLNSDNFEGRVNEVQIYQLDGLLGSALVHVLMDYLDNNWTLSVDNFTRNNETQLTAIGVDLSGWVNYAIKLNDSVFVTVKSATFGGVDTILIVDGYKLPEVITTVEFRVDNEYTLLLNGTSYVNSEGNTVKYNGLRNFLAWHLLVGFITDGDNKQSDVGNISLIGDNFAKTSNANKSQIKAAYLQNSVKESNNISNYLNTKSSTFPLWSVKGEENVNKFSSFIF